MKKLLAIFFISLLTLHYVGFYFAFVALHQRIENVWESRFEKNNFENTQLQEIALPITFPYMHDQSEYVNVDETMQIDGKIYRIVQKRYVQDTLHLIYVNDKAKEDVTSLYHKWLDNLQDKNQTTQGKIALNTVIDKLYVGLEYDFSLQGIDNFVINHRTLYINNFQDIYLETIAPPPKFS